MLNSKPIYLKEAADFAIRIRIIVGKVITTDCFHGDGGLSEECILHSTFV